MLGKKSHILGLIWALLAAAGASGGTGVGSMLVDHTDTDFDFRIAHPNYWKFQEADRSAVATWTMDNSGTAPAGRESWVQVQFRAVQGVDGLDELRTYIAKEEPNITEWRSVNGEFVGWGTVDLMPAPGVSHIIEYYLSSPGQIIRIERLALKDANGYADVVLIMETIDRAANPPRITSIQPEKSSYAPGEEVCYLVEVNDLKGSFKSKDLAPFKLSGQYDHWAFHKVEWIPKRNWFRACAQVLSKFTGRDLEIEYLTVASSHGESIECELDDSTHHLECNKEVVKVKWPSLYNANPDLKGPQIEFLEYDAQSREIKIKASDSAGVLGGYIGTKKDVSIGVGDVDPVGWTIFPENASGLQPIAVGKLPVAAVVIDSIYLFDGNGNPALLRVPADDCADEDGLVKVSSKKKRKITSSRVRELKYQYVDSEGHCSPTDFLVISFLGKDK